MFFLEKPLHVICFVFVFVVLVSIGPSFEDFTSNSIVEFTTFYVNLTVIFGAGMFMKGPVNRRFMLIYACTLVANHYVFYTVLLLFQDNIYMRFWAMFIGTLPMYIMFNYYNAIQCKMLSVMDKLGVNERIADRIAGPIGTTNFMLTFASYATFWLTVDFAIASYASIYGITHGLAADGSIVKVFNTFGHFNIFAVYDASITVIDGFFTILIAHRIIRDQKRPDALGVGRNMTWS